MFVAYIRLFMFVHIRTAQYPMPSVIWIDPKSEITIDHFGSDPGSGLDDPSVYNRWGRSSNALILSNDMGWLEAVHGDCDIRASSLLTYVFLLALLMTEGSSFFWPLFRFRGRGDLRRIFPFKTQYGFVYHHTFSTGLQSKYIMLWEIKRKKTFKLF